MGKVFILGHKGFIGSHLTSRLQELGYDVVFDTRYFNDRYDVLINLAAVTHIRNEFDPKMIESNIILVNELFRRPERIIQASSCSAAFFTNPYSLTKLWAEHLSQKRGNSVCLRFFNVYGLGNNKGIVKFLTDQPDGAKITIRGEQLVRDYIHVDDVVNEIIKYLPDGGSGNWTGHETTKIWAESERITFEEAQEECNNGFGWHHHRKGLLRDMTGVVDVGTGVATETMDLVNLYMKLSGKSFSIYVEDAGENEPPSMVSNNIVPHISLAEGLTKLINNENNN